MYLIAHCRWSLPCERKPTYIITLFSYKESQELFLWDTVEAGSLTGRDGRAAENRDWNGWQILSLLPGIPNHNYMKRSDGTRVF